MGDQRRFHRYERNDPVRARISGAEFDAVMRDVSAGGAAIVTEVAVAYQNDQFVELHDSAFGRRKGRIVRGIPEGFAMEFEQDEKEREALEEELEKFHRALGSGLA